MFAVVFENGNDITVFMDMPVFIFYLYKSYNSLLLVSPPPSIYTVGCILILNIK